LRRTISGASATDCISVANASKSATWHGLSLLEIHARPVGASPSLRVAFARGGAEESFAADEQRLSPSAVPGPPRNRADIDMSSSSEISLPSTAQMVSPGRIAPLCSAGPPLTRLVTSHGPALHPSGRMNLLRPYGKLLDTQLPFARARAHTHTHERTHAHSPQAHGSIAGADDAHGLLHAKQGPSVCQKVLPGVRACSHPFYYRLQQESCSCCRVPWRDGVAL
jgi:hypothetical protein